MLSLLHSFFYDRWTPCAMILLLFMAEFRVSKALKKTKLRHTKNTEVFKSILNYILLVKVVKNEHFNLGNTFCCVCLVELKGM